MLENVLICNNKEYKIKKPLFISVPITSICNARCEFCINKNNFIPQLKIVNLLKSLDKLLYLTKGFKPTVSITGGEPTLYPDIILDIIKICEPHDVKIFLMTNGSGLLKKTKDGICLLEALLNNINLINISRSHHNYVRNNCIMKSNTLMGDKTMKKIFNIANDSITKIRLSSLFLKEGINDLNMALDYCDWAINLGCKYIVFRDLQKPQNTPHIEQYITDNMIAMEDIWQALNNNSELNKSITVDRKYFNSRIIEYKNAEIRFQKFVNCELLDNEINEFVLCPNGKVLNGWNRQEELIF
ncbi:MAG: radical SAM protein [Rickettsiales bacterium]|nr:radical SAM protein [Rickettsiales bacterium]